MDPLTLALAGEVKRRALTKVAAGVIGAAAVVTPVVIASTTMMTVAVASTSAPATGQPGAGCVTAGGDVTGFSPEQTSIAATAISVGQARGIPEQGWVVILAAGFQESGLHNLDYGDRDSVGWLQQRAGWGTVAERMNPGHAAGSFYDALGGVPGWQGMPVTVAAQAVQRSAFPDAYAKWEADARTLVAGLAGKPCQTVGTAGARTVTDPSSGITHTIPIPAGPAGVAVNAALDQLGIPYSWGGGDMTGPTLGIGRGASTVGWDCSGLTEYAWGRALHRSIGGTTMAQEPRLPLAPSPHMGGDLIYHGGHMQMFLGTVGGVDLIVEAPRTGLRVRVVPLWGADQITSWRRPA